ncbi:MAG: hypothetical protein C0183_16700, partial [Roseiflexus castenholzii]
MVGGPCAIIMPKNAPAAPANGSYATIRSSRHHPDTFRTLIIPRCRVGGHDVCDLSAADQCPRHAGALGGRSA